MNDNVVKTFSSIHKVLHRLSGGRIGGRVRGAPILMLTTTGRKTGQRRTTPLMYLDDGDRKVIVASKGGDDRMPVWYLNLTANPEVDAQIGSSRQRMKATTASPEERARLWPQLVAMYSDYDAYQKKTDRQIPVVILTPA